MPATATPKMPDAFYDCRLLSRKQAQEFMGIEKAAFYRYMRRKKDPIPTVKLGRSRKVQLDKLLWWIEKQAE